MSDFVDGLRGQAAASLFPAEGELRVAGLGESVEIGFDRWGVPYISASSLDDLWFAQGFVSAGERLFQIDLALRAANGRLSEIYADRTLDDDRFVRVIGLNRAGATYAASWSEASRKMAGRFVEGVHAWIGALPAKPIEYTLLDIEPVLPSDLASWAACWAYLAWNLSGNMDKELARVALAEGLGAELAEILLPATPPIDPALAAGGLAGRLLSDLPRKPGGVGSNNWVVAGSRTTTGKPLLANDPHLLVQQPGAWLEMHLRAPGYEARGVALPFFPAIAIGASSHHAWGVTNVTGDVQDLFLEELNEDRTAARFDGRWEPFSIHHEEIIVRGSADPVVLEVPETRHGPILESFVVGELDPEYRPLPQTYALRWTGHDVGVEPTTFLDVANATNFEEFREAVGGLECPGQNFVYADVDGHIGYQCSGRYPRRLSGDGTVPVPGTSSEFGWDGWIPFEELPWAADPEPGFLATANNRIHDESYPHLIGNDFLPPYRATRIGELIEARELHDADSFRAIQTDTVALAAREILGRLKEPPAALDGWDGDLAADSAQAAFFARWIDELLRIVMQDEQLRSHYGTFREDLVCSALPRLLDEGRISQEELDRAADAATGSRTWGDVHTARFAHPLASIPGLEGLFVAAELPLGGDDQTVSQGGYEPKDGSYPAVVVPSWRVVWDLADLDRSRGAIPTGQSGNPASPHWADQNEVWAGGELHEMPFTEESIAAATVSMLGLDP